MGVVFGGVGLVLAAGASRPLIAMLKDTASLCLPHLFSELNDGSADGNIEMSTAFTPALEHIEVVVKTVCVGEPGPTIRIILGRPGNALGVDCTVAEVRKILHKHDVELIGAVLCGRMLGDAVRFCDLSTLYDSTVSLVAIVATPLAAPQLLRGNYLLATVDN